ncbi:hypothetical protein H1R20_g1728, partial [Candolleomyces eurysporus]|uniref:DASH complex subunit DAD1 n=2 Tax=Candolleomyces TaxID=2791032 RepID=A0A4Q2DUK6_9AGAR
MEEESTFFEKERDRLAREINAGFEDLLSSSNVLNRKLEEVLGMTKEYETIASLWQTFHDLMRTFSQPDADADSPEQAAAGLPGTGGHVVATNK